MAALQIFQQNTEQKEHNSNVEHYGSQFWHYYYPGEHPSDVLNKEPVAEREFKLAKRAEVFQKQMTTPQFAYRDSSSTDSDDISELARIQIKESEKRWYDHMQAAKSALACKNSSEALLQFRLALNEAEKWRPSDERLHKTLSGLADVLATQG